MSCLPGNSCRHGYEPLAQEDIDKAGCLQMRDVTKLLNLYNQGWSDRYFTLTSAGEMWMGKSEKTKTSHLLNTNEWTVVTDREHHHFGLGLLKDGEDGKEKYEFRPLDGANNVREIVDDWVKELAEAGATNSGAKYPSTVLAGSKKRRSSKKRRISKKRSSSKKRRTSKKSRRRRR